MYLGTLEQVINVYDDFENIPLRLLTNSCKPSGEILIETAYWRQAKSKSED